MELLNFETLAELLNLKDPRSIRRWCEKNNVFILKQGKQECVSQISFEEAFNKPFITHLRIKYGANWNEVYQMHIRGDLVALVNLKKDQTLIQKRYKPENELVKSFIKKYESDEAPESVTRSWKSKSAQPRSEIYEQYLAYFDGRGPHPHKKQKKKPGG